MSGPDWRAAAARDDFRNRVEVEYTDALSGERRIAVAEHRESYVALGDIWREVRVSEVPASVVNRPETAQQLADELLVNLCTP